MLREPFVDALRPRRGLPCLERVLRFESHELEHATRLEAVRPRVRSSNTAHRRVFADLDGRFDRLDGGFAKVQIGSTADGDDRRHATCGEDAPAHSIITEVRRADSAELLPDVVAGGDDGVCGRRTSQSRILVELRILERREEERSPESDDERIGHGVQVTCLQAHDVRGGVDDLTCFVPRIVDRIRETLDDEVVRERCLPLCDFCLVGAGFGDGGFEFAWIERMTLELLGELDEAGIDSDESV